MKDMAGANSMQLHRALPLNDSENTELFTFKLSLRNLEEFKGRHIKSSIIYYQGHEWYLTCKYSGGKDAEFIGVYVYWGSPSEGERCKADFRIIMRNIVDPTKSLVTEGSQVEFSAPKSPGWGKREFAPVLEIFSPGGGFLQEPEGIVIVELAMKSCSTILEQFVDFNQIMIQQRDQHFPSHFTSNFRLGGLEFYLSLYPLGDRPEANGHVSIYLHRFVGSDADQSALLGCRLRYRFFIGNLFCPSSSKTFEFSFKNEQGYGRFRGFEPIQEGGVFKMQGPTPIGVEVVACTPFVQPEIRLATKGYYHMSNIGFEDSIFCDHRGNSWKISVDPDAPTLNMLMRLNDEREEEASRQGLGSSNRSDSTKFVQWRAYVLSRSDRRKTLPVIGCPLTAYFSKGLPQKNFNMTTSIPLLKAKSLDGDYSSKEDPSLLVRLEMLNIQDIPGVLYDYPTLDFERFQLYHTREGLKRCLKQNELLMEELANIRGQSNPHGSSAGKVATSEGTDKKADGPGRTPMQQVPTRPTSLHTSSSLPSLANQSSHQGMSPSGRGPPPKPPPRAYSPISNDSNMKRYSFSRMAPLSASTATPSNVHPSPTNPGRSHFQHAPMSGFSGSSNSDSAFKRFSFTGINVTPSMISDQADSSSIHTPGQTAGHAQNHLTNGNQNNVAASLDSLQNLTVSNDSVVLRRQKPHHTQSHYRSSYQGSSSQGPSSQVPATSESAFKRFSFTGVNVSPAMTSDFGSGGQDASGSVHEQHNPIYQSMDVPPVTQRSDSMDGPVRTRSEESNRGGPPETSEDFIHKYTILQPDDVGDTSRRNPRIPSPQNSPKDKTPEKEHLLEFNQGATKRGTPNLMQTAPSGGFGWRPVDPKNPNSYMETEI